MKYIFFSILLNLIICSSVPAQPQLEWRNITNPLSSADIPYALAVALDSTGNSYICWYGGDLNSTTTGSTEVRKYSDAGQLLWVVRYDSSYGMNDFYPWDMKIFGSILFISGTHKNFLNFYKLYIFAIDTSGSVLWQQEIGNAYHYNDVFTKLAISHDGGVVVTGYSKSDSVTNLNIITAKFDINGNLSWSATYTNPMFNGTDRPLNLYCDSSGNTYVCGTSENGAFAPSCDMLLLKYNITGTLQFESRLNSNMSGYNNDYANGINESPSHEIWITGYGGSMNSPFQYLITAKFDTLGNYLNKNTVQGIQCTAGYSISFSNNGDAYVTGGANTNDTTFFIFTLKYDNACNLTWSKLFKHLNTYSSSSGMENWNDSLCNEYVAGFISDYDGYKMIILKYDSAGQLIWEYTDYPALQTTGIGTFCIHSSDKIFYTLCMYDSLWNFKINTVKLQELINGIDEMKNGKELHIFPNPFEECLNIKLEGEFVLSLFDAFGRKLFSRNFNNEAKISTENLISGIYYYNINVKGESSKNGKLIKI